MVGFLLGHQLRHGSKISPRCPQCNSNKLTYIGKHEEFDYPAGMNMKKKQNWTPNRSRHFKCDACEDEYLVPLISQEN